jgi:hypothetical protein
MQDSYVVPIEGSPSEPITSSACLGTRHREPTYLLLLISAQMRSHFATERIYVQQHAALNTRT